MHFCMDEVMALLAAVPFLGYAVRRLHAWWHRVRCPHRKGLFEAFRGYQGTVLVSATPPERITDQNARTILSAFQMTPEELDAECKKLDEHFATVRRE